MKVLIADKFEKTGIDKMQQLGCDVALDPQLSGESLVAAIKEHEPDILLLDLRMPGADGLTLLQRIQTNKLKTKVIVLTASEDEGEYVQAMKYSLCRTEELLDYAHSKVLVVLCQ